MVWHPASVDDREDLLALLAPVTKALRRIEDAAAARASLTMWQYAVLSVIVATPGLNQRQVATRLDYSVNRLVADLDELERRALLRRRAGADRRSNVLEATAKGERVMRQVRALIRAGEGELLGRLPADRQADVVTVARALALAVRASDGPDADG